MKIYSGTIVLAAVLAVSGCKQHTTDTTTTSTNATTTAPAPAPAPMANQAPAGGDLHNTDPTANATAKPTTPTKQ